MVQEQRETSQAICKAGHENHHPFEVEKQVWLQIIKGRLKGKKLNFVYDRFEIFQKKCKHSFYLSLSPVAYAKNFKWYEPPLVIDKETNMQILSKEGCMEIGKVRKLYPHLPAG